MSSGEWSPTSAAPAKERPARRFDTAAAMARTGLRTPERSPAAPAAEPTRERVATEVPAPLRRRVASTGLDTLLCAALVIVPFWRVYERDDSWWPPLTLLAGVAMIVLVTVLRARSGRSLFSGVFGIRTVVGDPGEAPGLRVMLRRHLVSAGAFLAGGASVWSAFTDSTGGRRTWQDAAAGTRVIDTRWGADPLEKAGASESETTTDPGDVGGALLVERPLQGSGRARPGLLPNGLDMTPATAEYAGVAGTESVTGRAPAAVIDAAERAAGGSGSQTPRAVVVESATERIVARLVDDTGRSVAIARSALIGRDPITAQGEEVEHLIVVDDPGRTVSKTHLRVDVAEHGLTVVDRGSSNGTTVRIGGVDHVLEAWVPLGIPVGTTLLLGERAVTVEAP